MLADLGYVAFCLDMYGEVAQERDDAMRLLNAVSGDQKVWGERIRAGLVQLKAQPTVDTSRLAAIGFCFGGMTVLELVRASAEVKCVVAFHPAELAVAGRHPHHRGDRRFPAQSLVDRCRDQAAIGLDPALELEALTA